jgi:GDP-L-fucose synthase
MKSILVTGGSGLIGYSLRKIVDDKYKWIFLSSKDCDLKDLNSVRLLFELHRPDIVIHLAAEVGGLFKNLNNNSDMFFNNNLMNTNVMLTCEQYDVKMVISCLSTCVFPDEINIPITEDNLHNGPPHNSNRGYAYSKRMLDIMSNCLSDKYPDNKYICIIPTNIYGPNDNFNLDNGHVLPSIIHKMYLAKQSGSDLYLRGTGFPRRQFISAGDISRIILQILELSDVPTRIILSPSMEDELSISELACHVKKYMNFDGRIIFDNDEWSNGQYRKTVSNDVLCKLLPNLMLTPLSDGIKETIEWFLSEYPNIRS